nr:hypothetical protein [Streptomyces sp. A1499]
MRQEQFRREQQRLAGVGHGPVAEREPAPGQLDGAAHQRVGGLGARGGQQLPGTGGSAREPGVVGGRRPAQRALPRRLREVRRRGEGRRALGVADARARVVGRGHQRGGECGVGAGRRQRPVHSAEQRRGAGVVEGGGEQPVGGPAPGGRGVGVEPLAQAGGVEADAAVREVHDPGGLRGDEGRAVEARCPRRAQDEIGVGARALGPGHMRRGGEQQHLPGLGGQAAAGRRGPRGQRSRQGGPPGELGRGQSGDDAVQEPRIAVRGPQHLVPHGGSGLAPGQLVEERARLIGGQRVQAQDGQLGQVRVVGTALGDGDEQAGGVRPGQAAGGEAEGGAGRRVPQVDVVDAEQEGAAARQGAHHGEQGPRGLRRRGEVRSRTPQGVQSAVGDQALRGHGPGAQDRARARGVAGAEGAGGVREQRGAPEPGGRGEHEGAATARVHAVGQGVDGAQPGAPASCPEGGRHGRRSGHDR